MNDWTKAEIDQRQRNVADARKLQTSQQALDHALETMARWGARNVVKVTEAGGAPKAVQGGYVTLLPSLLGSDPLAIGHLLGLRPGALAGGAYVYRLKVLPAAGDIAVRGYTTLPDGAALPEGRAVDEAGYRAGLGAIQWQLRRPVAMEFVGYLAPGAPFALAALATPPNFSGAAWWHANQAKWATSTSVDDLKPVFAAKVKKFLAALRAAGAEVRIAATLRPKLRAHLMHYCAKLARGDIRAAAIPAVPGLDIVWDHGDEGASRKAAKEMAKLFEIVFPPSLTSHHVAGKAIDMKIRWNGAITVKTAQGRAVTIPGPGDGATSKALHKVGASYGVIKLLRDAPHWSVDGR